MVVLQLALAVFLLRAPRFAPTDVEIHGLRHASRSQVLAATGLDRPRSIFLLDGDRLRDQLDQVAWVYSATVAIRLPSTVEISVKEWSPVAAYQSGSGALYYLSSEAVALGPAPADVDALRIQGPLCSDPRPGRRVLDPTLLRAMVNIQRAFPALYGVTVRSYELDADGVLVLTTARGWQVNFGRLLTEEDVAGLEPKLRALKAFADSGQMTALAPGQTVNLMDPQVVAIGPPPPSPSPSPTPAASPRSITVIGAGTPARPTLTPKPTPGIKMIVRC